MTITHRSLAVEQLDEQGRYADGVIPRDFIMPLLVSLDIEKEAD